MSGHPHKVFDPTCPGCARDLWDNHKAVLAEVSRLKAALEEAERGYRYEADVAQQAINDRDAALARVSALEGERDRYKATWANMLNRAERAESALSAAQREVERVRGFVQRCANDGCGCAGIDSDG